jgi:polyisoprenoid-binding protein YceI
MTKAHTRAVPRFRVNPEKSTVDVRLRVNLHPSHVSTSALSGTIDCELDAAGRPRLDRPYGARLTLPVKAISSGNALQDREMRRRFDASRYPTITVNVDTGESLGKTDRYRAVGRLTMHGQTREIAANVRVRTSGREMTITGKQVLNVREFGIDPPRLILLRMEPEVDVRVHIVAERGAARGE